MSDKEQVVMDGQDLQLDVETPEEYHVIVEFGPEVMGPPPGSAGTRSAGTRSAGTRSAKAAQQIEQRSQDAISAAMSTIREMAMQTDLMRKGIPGGSQPRMVKVKFGVNLNFEVGAVLAKSGVGATLEVELEWARRSDDVLRVLRAETDVQNALFASSDDPE